MTSSFHTVDQGFVFGLLGRFTAKDEAGVALGNPGRRRVRGWAAQQVFAAFLLAETATRRIQAFLRDAKTAPNGDLYVDRYLAKDKQTGKPTTVTSGAPPGAEPPADDEQAA